MTERYLYCISNVARDNAVMCVYTPSEMEEIFTAPQRADLDAGKTVTVKGRYGTLVYVDAVAAAQAVITNGGVR